MARRYRIPVSPTESVFMVPVDPTAACQVHDWSTRGLARRLVAKMRETHGRGGVNVCANCIKRARADAALGAYAKKVSEDGE